jgi:hypothetical protein
MVGVGRDILGEEEDDEPKPRVLTKEEAKAKRREMANKIGYWSATARKREQIYGSNG